MSRMSVIIASILLVVGIIWFYNRNSAVTPPYLPPPPSTCGDETCHGWDITCGADVPEACTEIYTTHDICRYYAQCAVVNGNCTLQEDPYFEDCKECVLECEMQYSNEPDQVFICAESCRL